jgi:hypothetical protein
MVGETLDRPKRAGKVVQDLVEDDGVDGLGRNIGARISRQERRALGGALLGVHEHALAGVNAEVAAVAQSREEQTAGKPTSSTEPAAA